jgi:hypothetical protein
VAEKQSQSWCLSASSGDPFRVMIRAMVVAQKKTGTEWCPFPMQSEVDQQE